MIRKHKVKVTAALIGIFTIGGLSGLAADKPIDKNEIRRIKEEAQRVKSDRERPTPVVIKHALDDFKKQKEKFRSDRQAAKEVAEDERSKVREEVTTKSAVHGGRQEAKDSIAEAREQAREQARKLAEEAKENGGGRKRD